MVIAACEKCLLRLFDKLLPGTKERLQEYYHRITLGLPNADVGCGHVPHGDFGFTTSLDLHDLYMRNVRYEQTGVYVHLQPIRGYTVEGNVVEGSRFRVYDSQNNPATMDRVDVRKIVEGKAAQHIVDATDDAAISLVDLMLSPAVSNLVLHGNATVIGRTPTLGQNSFTVEGVRNMLLDFNAQYGTDFIAVNLVDPGKTYVPITVTRLPSDRAVAPPSPSVTVTTRTDKAEFTIKVETVTIYYTSEIRLLQEQQHLGFHPYISTYGTHFEKLLLKSASGLDETFSFGTRLGAYPHQGGVLYRDHSNTDVNVVVPVYKRANETVTRGGNLLDYARVGENTY